MATLIFRTLKSPSDVRRFASRTSLCLLAAASAMICLAVLVAENDAEQVDSGWAVAPTPTIAKGSKHTHPQQQITIDNILHHAQPRLLQLPLPTTTATSIADDTKTREGEAPAEPNRPAGTTQPELRAPLGGFEPPSAMSTTPATNTKGDLRFAARNDGIEGWRPANSKIGPLNENRSLEVSAPQLNAPHSQPTVHADAPAAKNITPTTEPASAEPGDVVTNEESCGEDSCGDDSTMVPEPSNNADLAPATRPDEVTPIEISPDDDAPIESTRLPMKATKSSRAGDVGSAGDDSTASDNSPAPQPELTKTPPPPLTKQLMSLRTRVRSVLKGYYRKQLNSRDNDPWEVMHGMLAYGVHSRIRQGGPRGEPVTSVGWLCYNKPCKNLNLMYVNPKGELRAKYGVGLQGHLGQLLAMLAQCRVSDEYPIRVGKRQFTIKDLIESEKKTCYPKSELTFKLIAFQYYLDLNDNWENDQGVDFDIPRVIREELAQPIRGAACGGTHRLSSLSLTVKTRVRRGEPLDGEYARAAAFVDRYHQYAFKLQNRDGSLSTNWFRGRGDDSDINRRIKTTGHILEWLCYSLSDTEMRDPKTIAAVSYLANLMYSNYDNEWEVGPMCHATHALLLYDERVFQPFDAADHNITYRPKRRLATSSRPAPPSASRR